MKFTSATIAAMALFLASSARADFVIGYSDGAAEAGDLNHPTIQAQTNWIFINNAVGVIDEKTLCADENSLSPSALTTPEGTTNLCGDSMKNFCNGKDLVIGNGGDCGATGATAKTGDLYAELFDRGDGNKHIGHCAYDRDTSSNCVGYGSREAETIIRCFTSEC